MAADRWGEALEQAGDRIVAGRAMDGDVAAFAVLVRRYTPMMRAYTHRMLNASAEVDDIVQDAFVTAWQRFGELEDPAKVKSWLMRIVSRKAVDRLRQTRPALDVDEIDRPAPPQASPAAVVEARAGVAALGAALRELPRPSASAGCCGSWAATATTRSPRSSASPSARCADCCPARDDS